MIADTLRYQVDPALFAGQIKSKTENLQALSSPEGSKARLKETAKELEALFFFEILKELRKTSQGGLLGKGLGNDVYTSLFDMELARLLAGRGVGLKEMIQKKVEDQLNQKKADPANPLKNAEGSSLKAPNVQPTSQADKPVPTGPRSGLGEYNLQFPVHGRISSKFGWREDPFTGQDQFHGGIDIAAQSGEEVYPLKSGQVIFSGWAQGYGQTIIIDHGDGFVSKYGHNLANLVSVGTEVNADQAIALVGSSGKSTGPHLHFEVLYQGEKIDPLQLVQKAGSVAG